MHLAHFFDFVQVYHETLLVSMVLLDALPAENVLTMTVIKVLDPVRMLLTELVNHHFLIVVFEVKSAVSQLLVFLHYLV